MLELLISATEDNIVCLFDGGALKAQINAGTSAKAEEILGLVDKVLEGAKISDLKRIYINVGPGSFTGIRASLALVFGLTASMDIQIIPFTSFDMLEYNKEKKTNYAFVLSGFGNMFYAKYNLENKAHEECIDINDLAKVVRSYNITVVTNNEALKTKLEPLIPSVILAQNNMEKIVKLHHKKALEKREVVPVYLRASQAEIQRAEKLKNGK
jgi:tRNA threonylcarbamoyl adenosine modification protein YeaZ